MNKFLSIALLIIMIASGIGLFSCSGTSTTTTTTNTFAEEGKPAPDFQLVNIEGNNVKLSSFKGKPVMLNFWATWCGPCMEEMPFMQQIYKTWSSKGLVFLSMNTGEPVSKVKGFAQRYSDNYTFPILCDTKGEVARRYSIKFLPMTFLIDRDGILLKISPGGFPNKNAIEQELLIKVFPEIPKV